MPGVTFRLAMQQCPTEDFRPSGRRSARELVPDTLAGALYGETPPRKRTCRTPTRRER